MEKQQPAAATAADIRKWMQAVMERTGMTARTWAQAAGIAPSTIFRALKPDYEFVTSSRTLTRLAAAAGVTAPDATTRDLQVAPRFLPVRYRVQAGHWYETGFEEPVEDFALPVLPHPQFSEWPQWLEKVVGDSANMQIPDGHYVHVVDAIEMGYAPQDGDWVVVERRRDQGAIRERTVKQVAVAPDGHVQLWPRSTNPRWSKPVVLTDGARDGEELEVEVVGLVIGSYNPEFSRRF